MNKKLFSAASLMMSILTGCMFTSCLEGNEEDNEGIGQAYFTVDGNASQIILHQDGGGTIIPTMSSFKNPADFLKNERYILQYKYRVGNISADATTITGAEIIAGEVLDVRNPLSAEQAAERHLSDPDSIFAVSSVTHTWAYRGYLNVLSKAYYSMKDNKGIFPTYNLMYDPADVQQNRVKFTLLYNRHSAKSTTVVNSPSVYEMATSFRLSELSNLVPGSDSIEMTINVQGVDKPSVIKVGRADLQKANYK